MNGDRSEHRDTSIALSLSLVLLTTGLAALAGPAAAAGPTVDAGPDQLVEGGAEVTLSGHATDDKALDPDDYVWSIVGGPLIDSTTTQIQIGTGETITHTFQTVGVHIVQLNVTDSDGNWATDTADITVDDAIHASGSLDGVDKEGDMWIFDADDIAPFSSISGQIDVVDHALNPVQGAAVSGQVLYYGTTINNLEGVVVEDFEATTDESGVASFTYSQDLNGVAQAADDVTVAAERLGSIANLPGYHEIQVTVTSDALVANPPVDGQETDTLTIKYWVGHGVVGPS